MSSSMKLCCIPSYINEVGYLVGVYGFRFIFFSYSTWLQKNNATIYNKKTDLSINTN